MGMNIVYDRYPYLSKINLLGWDTTEGIKFYVKYKKEIESDLSERSMVWFYRNSLGDNKVIHKPNSLRS